MTSFSLTVLDGTRSLVLMTETGPGRHGPDEHPGLADMLRLVPVAAREPTYFLSVTQPEKAAIGKALARVCRSGIAHGRGRHRLGECTWRPAKHIAQ